jgi:hypothetical protein
LASIGSIGGKTGKSTVFILVHRLTGDGDLDPWTHPKLIAGVKVP